MEAGFEMEWELVLPFPLELELGLALELLFDSVEDEIAALEDEEEAEEASGCALFVY